jgi:aryl-alcohol dehydrogenase-like predicted oxidoreductase
MVISLVECGLIDSVQTILNIFDSEPLDTLVPIRERNGVAVIALHPRGRRPDRV